MKRLLPRLFAAAALFVALACLSLSHYCPPLPNPLAVDLLLPAGRPGQAEPLVVTGRTHFGDFLYARYIDETHVIFGYDSWGFPGYVGTVPVKLTPGQPLHLRLTMPGLVRMDRDFADPPGPLRVECDGATVLAANVSYFLRQPQELHLAENPLGGTTCGPRLHGWLLRPDGRELRGRIDETLTLRDRLPSWWRQTLQPWCLLALCSAIALGWNPLRRLSLAAGLRALVHHRWFVGTVAVSAVVFAWMITWGELQLLHPERLGSFYDFQAISLLHGHLDVPDEAIGGEAFIVDGKIYGYFGPTPALLRMPLLIFDLGFGQLGRGFMLAYFVAALTACYLLLRQAVRLIGPATEPSPAAIVLFLGSAGLGSTLFHLASRAYVYHEAILCGAAFALFASYFSLRHLAEPGRRWWLWAFLCGLLSLHARAPTGLFALTLLGGVCAVHLLRELRLRPAAALAHHGGLGLLCVAAVLTFNGLSYLKFHTFDGAPLRFSRPFKDPERLAKFDGKNFHAANVPFGAYTYLLRPNFHFERSLPYVYLGATTPPRPFPDAKIDLPDVTLALPYAMPGLFLLATAGCALAFVRHPGSRSAILVTWAAVLPMALALFAAIATAQRYTADFVPFLAGAATLGLAAAESAPGRVRLAARAAFALLTLAAVLATFAFTLHHQRETVWGIPDEFRSSYRHLRRESDKGDTVRHVLHFLQHPSRPPSPASP